ncbi:hypothetical protein Mesil_3244 (plasmid) [Allomeiothermus silvanus DSM 9946]|uniref:Uncharacterized protein n=1 Tax=Allomeiothermus silvanus (strain ATCC 700542 / DSM 9946 / NBRC 106475 / NCIMB 13440 / VI-R2) TaxID=526227 RepID=D7BIQ4_ALLS1|nr:hypothetical protein Mesil_3244 [Allomeiothermus silvanus DSM 9946]
MGVSWYEAKASIVRDAIRTYLAHQSMSLPQLRKSYRDNLTLNEGR